MKDVRLFLYSIAILFLTMVLVAEGPAEDILLSTDSIDSAEAAVAAGPVDKDAPARASLTVTPSQIEASVGGSLQFGLYGAGMAGKKYALLTSVTGTAPGTALPGGLVLPLNWDWFTDLLLNMAISANPLTVNFLGKLDAGGNAVASLTFPPFGELYEDVIIGFAWCTFLPYTFVSDDVFITYSGKMIEPAFFYDDGTAEDALGLNGGGQSCWIHGFTALPTGEEICGVSTAFGCPIGGKPPAGAPVKVYVWDDPNNDGNPSDAVLLLERSTVVTAPGTNQFLDVVFDPMTVTNHFFVGVMCEHGAGVYPAPLDEDTWPSGKAWFVGDTTNHFNPNNLGANDVPPFELSSNGYSGNWLLRVLAYQ